MGHVVNSQQVLLDRSGLFHRVVDVDPLRQPEVHDELRARGVGKEAPVDELETIHRHQEYPPHHPHGQPAHAETSAEKAAVSLIEAAAVGVGLARAGRRWL